MRVEQEQKVAEDARIFAEQDADAQRYAVQILQVPDFTFEASNLGVLLVLKRRNNREVNNRNGFLLSLIFSSPDVGEV